MTKYMIAPTGRKIEDLTGQTFNRLKVLEFANRKDSDNRWLWKCECQCDEHNIVYTSMSKLKSNNTKSCGCLQKEWAVKKNKANALDITGERKGTLTAIKKVGTGNTGNIWLIHCDCGNDFNMAIGEWNRDKYGNGHRARLRCPKCNETSKGQLCLRKIFNQYKITAYEEWTDNGKCKNNKTNGILRFDFYLPDYNCCVEYDGQQHFESNGGYYTPEFVAKVKERDSIKNQYCKDNGIKLIRIPYIDYIKLDYNYLKEKGVFDE